MRKLATGLVAVFLFLHGIAHLVGTGYGLKAGGFSGLAVATLWTLGAAGFALAALALAVRWRYWRPFLVGVTLYSLTLTVFVWSGAYRGGIINLVILAAMALEKAIPRLRYS